MQFFTGIEKKTMHLYREKISRIDKTMLNNKYLWKYYDF